MTNFDDMANNTAFRISSPIAKWLLFLCLFASIFTFNGLSGQSTRIQQKAPTELVFSNKAESFDVAPDGKSPIGQLQCALIDQNCQHQNAILQYGRLTKIRIDVQSRCSVFITTCFHLHHSNKIPQVLSDDAFDSFLG